MDIIIYIFSGVLLLVGLIGCLLPIIPGPPLSYIGLLLLQLTENPPFSDDFLTTWFIATAIVQVLDYIVPTYGTKKYGGSRAGVTGSIIGLVAGLFLFPPIGIILGPMVGALVGELMIGRNTKEAGRSAWGSFIGFLFGTVIKLAACSVMLYYFAKAVYLSLV